LRRGGSVVPAKGQPELAQFGLNLLERLFTEVAHFKQVNLIALDEVAERVNVVHVHRVGDAGRQVERVDTPCEQLYARLFRGTLAGDDTSFPALADAAGDLLS
jgi:hypothetical protein